MEKVHKLTIKKVRILSEDNVEIEFEEKNARLQLSPDELRKRCNLNGTPVMDFNTVLEGKEFIFELNKYQNAVGEQFAAINLRLEIMNALGVLDTCTKEKIMHVVKDFAAALMDKFDKLKD